MLFEYGGDNSHRVAVGVCLYNRHQLSSGGFFFYNVKIMYKGVEVNLSPGSVQKIQNAFHLASNIQILYHLFQFFQSLIDFSRKRYADKAQKHPKAGVGHTNLTAYVHRHFAVIPDVLF